jgi:HK97 family phage portal protein
MPLLERLFPRRQLNQPSQPEALTAGQQRSITGIKTVSETPGIVWGRPTSSAGVRVDEYEALTISAVFAACFRLANIAAMLPVGVYQKSADGKREEQTAHPASRILAIESNPMMTAFTARHVMQFWKPLFGSTCAEIGWDGAGRPRYLWPLEPWRVAPRYDDEKRGQGLHFRVDGQRDVASADMIYIPHVTEDGVCGKGFLEFALESLGSAIAADRSAGRFFQNDMKPGGILQHDANPDKKARDEMREGWGRYHGGVENRGKVGVLWGGWKWIRDAGMIDPDSAQLLETRQWSVTEVARWLNVPPHWLAELGRATWANIESQSIEALIYSVGPMLVSTEQEYDRKLLDPPRLYCKHNVNALLRSDSTTRSNFYAKMKEIGVYTTNMILGFEDENGIGPEGDQRFVPVNWQPADDLMTGGAAQEKANQAKQAGQPTPISKQLDAKPVESELKVEEPPVSSPAPVVTGQPSQAVLAAVRAVAEHALSGLAKKEVNEARRAAKKVNDVTKWLDGFYPGFEALMAEGLLATATLVQAQKGDDAAMYIKPPELSALWAGSWVETSRAELLAAMECKTEEWPNKSAALFTAWEGRAGEVAARIAEGVKG